MIYLILSCRPKLFKNQPYGWFFCAQKKPTRRLAFEIASERLVLVAPAKEENTQRNGKQDGEHQAVNEDHRRLQDIHAGRPRREWNVVLFDDADNGCPAHARGRNHKHNQQRQEELTAFRCFQFCTNHLSSLYR